MGFKKFINSNKILSSVAACMLLGTNVVLAQAATAAAGSDKAAQPEGMWTGVVYYVLLFLLVCIGVAVIGKILKI